MSCAILTICSRPVKEGKDEAATFNASCPDFKGAIRDNMWVVVLSSQTSFFFHQFKCTLCILNYYVVCIPANELDRRAPYHTKKLVWYGGVLVDDQRIFTVVPTVDCSNGSNTWPGVETKLWNFIEHQIRL
ncbi:MAG: hypothetical protein AAFU80_08790 [Pseudomonadota bacterium]